MENYLLFCTISFLIFVQAHCSDLSKFKSVLPNPSVLPKWVPNKSHCTFDGVKCDPFTDAVTAIDLTNVPLGTNFSVVATFLLSIETLERLSLRGANVSGNVAFPRGSHCSSSLIQLDFSRNSLSGTASDLEGFGLCSALVQLNVSSNDFTAPRYKVSLKFESLDLSFNSLDGDVLGHLFVGGCGGLRWLSLRGNSISSTNFSTCENCPSLTHLDISRNIFSGNLPACKSLQVFDASFNKFSGPLDAENFGRSLKVLNLSSNGLTGYIPAEICNFAELEILYLQDNNLTGEIPQAIGNCTRLTALHLSFNYLTGRIPSSLGNLLSLRDLKLWFNILEGDIPRELTSITSLQALILDFNFLTGSIPDSISNCKSLSWLSLSNNMLSGRIPASLSNLPYLAILKLSNNSLSGEIPPELGDCRSLIWLDLSTNQLSGSIPPQMFKQSGNIRVNFISGKRYVFLRNQRNDFCRGTGNLLEFEGIKDVELDRVSSRYPCGFDRIYAGLTQPTFDNNGSMMYLDLSSNNLSGAIPKEIGAMLYLYILNLGNNNISGSIPSEIGDLKGLNILDLSFNKISGLIPQSLAGLSLLNLVDLSNNNLTGMIPEAGQLATLPARGFLNNSGLCGIPLPSCDSLARSSGNSPSSHRRRSSLAGSVGMGVLFAVLCIVALIVVAVERSKRSKTKRKEQTMNVIFDGNSEHNTGLWKLTTRDALSASLVAFDKPLQKLNFADLLEATCGFHDDSLIGSGGFGDVYRAELKDGTTVAVKKLKHVSGQGEREFIAEMETIGKIKHRNLLSLLGYCKVGEERLLVYEYMKHGSLEDVLHDGRKHGVKLRWAERRNIAMGAARGLAFLHHSCMPHIIHRDMKSSNVLLDENLEARVSDFGMARLVSATDTHLSVSTLAGTPGYVPPEYYQSFRCSTRGDVYSYGVVLLELLTGKRPTDSSDFGDNNLVGWVKQHAKVKISDVFDAALMKEDPAIEIELLQHLKVACACLDDRPWRRPTMIQVMAMFKEIQAGSGIDAIASSKDQAITSINDKSEVTRH